MAKIDYFLVCENVVSDSSSKVSAINIFDLVNAEKLPALVSKFAIVTQLFPEEEDLAEGSIKINLEILDPKGSMAVEAGAEGKVEKDDKGDYRPVTSVIDLAGAFILPVEGVYVIKLRISNDKEPIFIKKFTVKKI